MKINAKTRLRAWELNPLKKTSGWKDWVRYDVIPPTAKAVAQSQQVGRIHGMSIYKDTTQHHFYVIDQRAEYPALVFGYNALFKTMTEELIAVNPLYQGQGLALEFYEWMLSKYKIMQSDTSLSIGAALLWKKLLEKHQGYVSVLANNEWRKVQIHGFQLFKGAWYPLVEREGQLVIPPKIKPTHGERAAIKDFRYVVEI